MIIATIILATAAAAAWVEPTVSLSAMAASDSLSAMAASDSDARNVRMVGMVGDGFIYLQYADWTNLLARVEALEASANRRREMQERAMEKRREMQEKSARMQSDAARVRQLARRNAIEQRQKYLKEKGVKK